MLVVILILALLLFHKTIIKFFQFIALYIYDLYDDWKNPKGFQGYGLHIFVGLFGAGKTISQTYKAYELAKKYPDLKILTNYKLENFPPHTKITQLTHYKQIIECEGNTLILIDEISSIFNSRNWKTEGIPAPLLSMLLQCRKERKQIFATAQRFQHVDSLIRQITFSVWNCKTIGNRWTFAGEYDAWEWENAPPLMPLPRKSRFSFIQTKKVRELYNTMEFIDKMKKEEYVSDVEILEKQGVGNINIIANQEPQKKKLFGLL